MAYGPQTRQQQSVWFPPKEVLRYFYGSSPRYNPKRCQRRNVVKLVYLEMTKALDRVFHLRLINRVNSHGICDPVLSEFTLYLAFRNRIVRVNGFTYQARPVTIGANQGSLLDPLPFLLFVNDIFYVARNNVPFLLANDIKIAALFSLRL